MEDIFNEFEREENCIDFLIDDEIEAIEGYEKIIAKMTAKGGQEDKIKVLEDIKAQEYEHIDRLKELKGDGNGIKE